MKKINEQGVVAPQTPKEKLQSFITNGCIPGGRLEENTGISGDYSTAVIVKTRNKNTLYFFHDGKIAKLSDNNDLKLIPETFTCEGVIAPKSAETQQKELQQNKALQAEITRLVQQKWSLEAPLKSMESLYEKLSVVDPTSYGLIGNKEMYRKKQTGNQQVMMIF